MSKKIIIGASGLIGNALYRTLTDLGQDVIGTFCHAEDHPHMVRFDLCHDDPLIFAEQLRSGDLVYLMSAYSNPSWIYANQDEARELNVCATVRFMDAVQRSGARLVFMSSVEVFDGLTGNYAEDYPPNPLNLYGQMKLEVENHIVAHCPNACIVRTPWNVGLSTSNRCVVRLTYESLLKPNARMAVDNFFSISSVLDTAEGLARLADHPNLRRIHLATDKVLNRAKLANFIITHSIRGTKMKYTPSLFSDIQYSEKRSRLNDLNNSLSRQVLGMSYRDAWDIVAEKIRHIDEYAAP